MCRSWRELSKAYFVAKFGFHTAENEPYQVCPMRMSGCAASEVPVERSVVGHGGVLLQARLRARIFPLLLDLLHERPPPLVATFANCCIFCQFWRARSRRYRSRFLRANIDPAGLLKLYKICTLLQCSTLINQQTFSKKNQRFYNHFSGISGANAIFLLTSVHGSVVAEC